jgi:hypothetical protein
LAIRRSSSADVEALLQELRAQIGDDAQIEGTYARLALIGPRAVSHILRALERSADPSEQAALFLALERIPDARSATAVSAALTGMKGAALPPPAVRLAAVRAARPLLDLPPEGTAVLERLTALVLDGNEGFGIRQAAYEALADLPSATLRPLKSRLAKDPQAAMRALTKSRSDRPAGDAPADFSGLEGRLPSNPDTVLDVVQRAGATAPLSTLHSLLKNVRSAEGGAGRKRSDWTGVRGAIHLVLARRESRVALYDLREAFEDVEQHPLPADFLTAVQLIGDGTCLEPLARAWMNAPRTSKKNRDDAWTGQLRETFQAVLARQRPAERKKTLDRLGQRWGAREHGSRWNELLEIAQPSGSGARSFRP